MARNRWRAPAAALVVLGLLTLSQGAALADGDPVGDLAKKANGTVGTVKKAVKPVTGAAAGAAAPQGSSNASTPSSPPGAPSSQDETPPNDVADPTAPDHAGAELLQTQVGGQPVTDNSTTRSTVNDDDSSKSDSSILTLGGTEVMGAHASSSGKKHDRFVATSPVTDPLCTGSAICLDVLYASADADKSRSTSYSDGSSGVARVCIGGNGDTLNCSAPVDGSVGGSASQIKRDRSSGRTTAASETSLADLCVSAPTGFPVPSEGCLLGITALSSRGQSDSGGQHSSASRHSSIAGLTAFGMSQEVDQTEAGEIPPGCTPGASLLCGYTNQGETYLSKGQAGHAQEALKAELLPGIVDLPGAAAADALFVLAARSETLVHNDGGEPTVRPAPRPRHAVVAGVEASKVHLGSGPAVTEHGGLLPNTGGVWSGLLAGGLLALGSGAILVVAGRRRMILDAV